MDHPRSRGEYSMCTRTCLTGIGSSPLSRGIRRPRYHRRLPPGIIPALAGNTGPESKTAINPGDHPRSRGEYGTCLLSEKLANGSSPLSRGIRTRCRWHRPFRRIIPALAGNTTGSVGTTRTLPDHPRSRGEYVIPRAAQTTESGSSPLSRGIPNRCQRDALRSRIIPALAGNTFRCISPPTQSGDHPRSRGEYDFPLTIESQEEGSSPLSRGILGSQAAAHRGARIIPALAGNTTSLGYRLGRRGDHPRSRGEYHSAKLIFLLRVGSSPLSRGIQARRAKPR